MTLTEKRIMVFAATGAVAGAVAREAAAQGATVLASGRDQVAVARLVADIQAAGGLAEGAVVDATDPDAVAAYVGRVAAGGIDGVFNGIGPRAAEGGYGTPADRLPFDTFLLPLRVIAGSTFLTARSVAPHLARKGGGAVVTLSASLASRGVPFMAGVTAACGAIEAMTLSLAAEFGSRGVRVNCVRGHAMPETRTIRETGALVAATFAAAGGPPPGGNPGASPNNLTGRPTTTAQVAQTVAFLLSDAAAGMCGQVVKVDGGF